MRHDAYEAAKKKVKAKKGFYGHLSSYLAVNTMMFIVVYSNGEGMDWAIPAFMWGMGLVIHYFSVFGLPGIGDFNGKEWEQKEISKELRKQGYDINEYDIIDESLELPEMRRVPREVSDEDFV